jgi:hypothetical protein
MLGPSQKAGLNSSQYDFQGVAVSTIINHRLDLPQVHISQLYLEQVQAQLVRLQVDLHPLAV